MVNNDTTALSLQRELKNVPKCLWVVIPVVMAVAAVLPGGLAGCPHSARWIFGFPFPNCYRVGTFVQGFWMWHPVSIVFNQVFWLVFLGALAVLSPKVSEKYDVGSGLFFFGSVLLLTILYFVFYRGCAMIFAENAF